MYHFGNDILFLGDVTRLRSLEANLEIFLKFTKTQFLGTTTALKSLCKAYIIETTHKWPHLENTHLKVFKTDFTNFVTL